MVDEVAGFGDELADLDCTVVGKAVDFVTVDETAVFDSADLLLVTAATPVVEVAGHSSTYVVSPPSDPQEALFVGRSRETPPCPSETTEIVTVCVKTLLEDVPTDDAKMFAVPAAVITGTLEVEDAVVELA